MGNVTIFEDRYVEGWQAFDKGANLREVAESLAAIQEGAEEALETAIRNSALADPQTATAIGEAREAITLAKAAVENAPDECMSFALGFFDGLLIRFRKITA